MERNLTVILVDDKANELLISIGQIGPNLYRFNMTIYDTELTMPYPLIPTVRAQTFRKMWTHLKKNLDSMQVKVDVINYFLGEELFDKADPIEIIEIILQVLRQQVISTHYHDQKNFLPIKPRCIHQAEQLLDNPNDPMKILDANGQLIKVPNFDQPELPPGALHRKLTLS